MHGFCSVAKKQAHEVFVKILNKIIARISWQNIKKISIGIFFLHANLFMKKPLNNPYSTNKSNLEFFDYLILYWQCTCSSSLNEIIIGSYCKKSDAIIFYRFEIDIFFTAIKIGTIFLSAPLTWNPGSAPVYNIQI